MTLANKGPPPAVSHQRHDPAMGHGQSEQVADPWSGCVNAYGGSTAFSLEQFIDSFWASDGYHVTSHTEKCDCNKHDREVASKKSAGRPKVL